MILNLRLFIKSHLNKLSVVLFVVFVCDVHLSFSQVSYGASATYSLRKTIPTYTGNIIQIRRACDNATTNIGFTSCGELDTVELKKFTLASNPLSAINLPATAAYSLRRLTCSYSGNAITVRRGCDNATKDIGFTTNGDLDTTSLKSFVLAANPLSALSTSAGAAFSLRKLRCAYAGSAIRIRSSAVGSPTLDIGFTANGDLDTASMKTFVGSNNAFVTIWYDQSGNNNNAVQSTIGNQPQIMVAGKVNRQGGATGQPAIIFSAALTSYLVMPYSAGTLNFSSASTTNAVFARTALPSGDATIFDQVYTSGNISVALSWNNGSGGYAPLSIGHFPSSSWSFVALPTDVALNANNIITGTMLSGAANTTTMNLYQNGTVAATASNKLTIGSNSNLAFNIGKRWDFADYAPANMQELIVFASVLSTTDRQYLEWGQSQYYNISGPSLTTLPAGAPNAYVTKWYDQSGNTKDVTQSATTNQPQIISAGKILRQNAMPAISFIASSATTFTLNTPMITDKISVSVVVKVNSANARNCLFDLGALNAGYPDFAIEANTYSTAGNRWGIYTNNNSIDANAVTSTSLTSLSLVANNTFTSTANVIGNSSFYKNGTAASLSCASCVTSVYRPSWPNGICIGNFNGAYSAYTDGYIPELIIFPSALSSVNRQYLEWSQSQYYSISGPTLAGLPSAAPSAFVTTWYDQSGNARNVTQPTNGNQPKIINSGVMSLQNGRPAISLDGTSTWFIQSTMSVTQPYSLNAIATRTVNGGGSGGYQRLVNISSTGDSFGYLGVFSGNYATFNGNGGAWNDIAACTPATGIALNSQAIMTMVSQTGATGLAPSANGTSLTLKNGTSTTATGFLLGGAWSGNNTSQLWPGTISEFHIFNSALSTTRRTLIETNQASHYTKTISNNKYTPPSSTTYNLFVNGIGRESTTDSIAGTRSTAGMGVSVTTAATAFLKDNGDYMTYGMNCRSNPHTSVSDLPATVTQRWENDWYVTKTDIGANNGLLSIFFDFSDYGVAMLPGLASNYVLLNRSSSAASFSIVPGTTVTTVADRVVFDVDATNITTSFYYTIGTKDVTTSPLPIELTDFTCNLININTVELKWATASESNSFYFLVERSVDGINYESIGKVNAAGNSVSALHYSLTDASALSNISYYRLKMVDLDETYKYSPICSTDNQKNQNNGDIIIYPNPTTGSLTVDFSRSVYNQPDTYSIMDITGKKIELSTIRHTNSVIIDMSSLQPGMYLLEVIKGTQKTVKKITLQK